MREYLEKYLKQRRMHREASRWISANDDRLALDIMFLLNHVARGSSLGRTTIYALKNRLVRNLYERGFCISVTLQKQELVCWRCEGSGEDPYSWPDEYDDGDCQKCGGTGVYRSHILYQFVFRVCDKTYVWHQPQQYVDWPVELSNPEPQPFHDQPKADTRILTPDEIFIYGEAVRVYLLRHGVSRHDVPRLYGIREIAKDIIQAKWRYSRAAYEWKQIRKQAAETRKNLTRLWEFIKTGEMPQPDTDMDIPF